MLTDHKPLVFALHRVRDAWSPSQGCHLTYVAEFTSDMRHVAGAAIKALRGALPAQVYPGGRRKGPLRVAGRPCGTGWEFRGLYNSSSSGGPCYPAGAHQVGRAGT